MTESTSYSGSRADLLDTGQWHLAVNISRHGFGAWLVPELLSGRPPRVLADISWPASDEGLLNRIEDVVYDHPSVLDDYSADIIIECDRQLWLPASEYPTDEDCAEAYTKAYGGDPYDVMVNELGEEKVAYMLTPGLKSFMQRSFPGARIRSQQSTLKESGSSVHDACECLVEIREQRADFILFKRGMLQCATTHPWKTESDITFSLVSILSTFSASASETDLIMSGIREPRQNIGRAIAGFVRSVSQKNHEIEGMSLPTAIYLAINRKINNANHTR